MCVSVCVCVCTSQNWPKRRCRHGKKIACKSSNRLRSSLRRCRRRCCRLFCDSQLFNFPIFQWKYSGLKSKSSPNLCQQEWCFSMYYMYIYIYISFILYILPWIRPWISLNNPELHNVICMEPRRIPGKNLLFGQKSKEFLEATKEKQKNIPGPFLKPVNVDCQRMGWFYVLSVFLSKNMDWNKEITTDSVKKYQSPKSPSYTSKILGNVLGFGFKRDTLEIWKKLMAFS